jgi:hypothetical protein
MASPGVGSGPMADCCPSDRLQRMGSAGSESSLSVEHELPAGLMPSCAQGRSMRASLNTITSMPLLSSNWSLMDESVGVMVQPLALLQLLMLEKSL